ncbi:biotin synthase BioB [uncultured Coprobacter sp.]|jgi:biotin synthase|uniref:biotin synthase BioB n=1 Tax=uncultured Coprobacter sp. TaxID=1720550 RepID=UPI0027D9A3EA|nr:biotin synthase BioB [uncultured Coprobacter sp.]
MIEKLKNKVLSGEHLSEREAFSLLKTTDKEALYKASGEITKHFCKNKFDMCSIINARSGKCPEDCKWCAQSGHYKTQINTYSLIDREECKKQASQVFQQKIHHLGLVTSGRKVQGELLTRVCDLYKYISSININTRLCASLGLLDKQELSLLLAAGVKRYHCNLETAPSYFPTLCSTHTQEEKIKTIRAAQEIGMEVCSGGIIGMGETAEQRIELAFTLKHLNIHSIPINILQPIPGTPLEQTVPLSPDELLTTIALFRFINPDAYLRLAGGRAQLSQDILKKALMIGINSSIVGDMLTTVGSKVAEDKKLFTNCGYSIDNEYENE